MNQVLQPPLPLASDNPFSSEQECIEHIGAHAHHSSFAAGVPDHLRREGPLGHSSSAILNPLPATSITSRYSAPRPDAPYQSNTFSDTGSGSISSPSSNASSSLAYCNSAFSQTATAVYPGGHLNLANNYSSAPSSYPFGNMSSRRLSALSDSPSAGMLPPTRSPGMNHSVAPVMSGSMRDNYTTSTPGLLRHPHTLSPRHSDLTRYSSLPETPRSLPTSMSLQAPPYGSPMTLGVYPTQSDRMPANNDSPPFNAQDNFGKIHCDQVEVTPTIMAKVDKGFFRSSDDVYTCYRRNYFAVSVSYTLHPWYSGGRLYLTHAGSKTPERIYALAVSLAAAVDGHTGKAIELIQHTPKRDKGPQIPMKKELLPPTPPGKSHDHSYGMNTYHQQAQVQGPDLPGQTETDAQNFSPTSHANNNCQHAFERIQFKSATANNGKRRAQQQYYHLIVELWANVAPREQDPRWVKVAACSSHPVVVRGRSPSHYQNEGPHNPGTSRGAGGSGVGGGGHSSLGPNGGSVYGGGYSNGISSRGGSGLGGGMYRGNTYSLDPSPVGSHSVSSASSLSGGPPEGLVGDHQMVDDEDNKMMEGHDGYQYYPAPIYENMPSKIERTEQSLSERQIKEEYPGPAAIATGWQVGGCGRFQGLETSRGYYPDVHAHAGY